MQLVFARYLILTLENVIRPQSTFLTFEKVLAVSVAKSQGYVHIFCVVTSGITVQADAPHVCTHDKMPRKMTFPRRLARNY